MTEYQNVEYKQTWRDDYLKWVYGFANTYNAACRNYANKEGCYKDIEKIQIVCR